MGLKVLDGQSLFDIATQEFGSLEDLFVLLTDNNLAINERLTSGQDLVINKTGVGNEDIKKFVTLKDITMNNFQGQKVPPLVSGDYANDHNNDYF